MKWVAAVSVVVQYLHIALAAKILAICGVPSRSHSLWCYNYMAALAEKGHQITVLGIDHPKIEIKNLSLFIADDIYKAMVTKELITNRFIGENEKIKPLCNGYMKIMEISTKAILQSRALKELIEQHKNITKPFDLIIHDNGNAEALLGLVPLFGNPPLLLATTFGSPHWMNFNAGNILNPSYVPSMITNTNQYMTFKERCWNTFYYAFLEWFYIRLTDVQDKLMRDVFDQNIPHVRDIAKRANIIIVNYNFALNDPRPMLPGVIGISGLHISDAQLLPQDIQEFMDEAENGVILLSFGTNVQSNWLQPELESIVIKALEQLPLRVLWKWDKTLGNVSPNIKIRKWLPQNDILAHPNIKLFITHCGLLSTQEAIYHKVPMVALPLFLDQSHNAALLVRHKIALQLSIKQLTISGLQNGIKRVISNPEYKENVQKLSELMRDMPQTAKQQAVFWTEYAIRHKGAAHLRSAAADMPWYQLLLLDVLALFLFIFFLIVWLIKIVLTFTFTRISKTKVD